VVMESLSGPSGARAWPRMGLPVAPRHMRWSLARALATGAPIWEVQIDSGGFCGSDRNSAQSVRQK
jgi:hypothetical protein